MAEAEKAEKAESLNAPFFKLWSMLRPNLRSIFRDEWELLPFAAVCLARGWEVRWSTELVRSLDKSLVHRNPKLFWGLGEPFPQGMMWGVVVGLYGAWLSMIYNYLRARLSWKWRRKLVNELHDRYFSGMTYYLVSEGGAQGSQRMADPDTRLTDDLNKATDGFCNTFCNVLYTATAGVFHSVELWKHNWVLGLAPYVYLAISFAFVDYITPVRKTWRPLGRERGRTWGIYCHGQMKLIEKAESVAALNGSEREARLFCEQSTAVRVACYKQHCKFWQFGMINHFFNTYLAGELFPICIISHGILNPKHSSLDTIEDMMEVRSDVGVLWVLFSRAFQSARTVIDSLRTLQQLVGDVERVTELIELLDKVTEDKKTEASHTIKDGDMIAFENVDIVTPAGVGLVNDLSFQLKRGESLLLVGHNGAGKSSIFRCLGGLWSAKGGGTITKPQGGDGLHQEIFYIPQKSYNVLGTLQDQMTYPASGAEDLSEEKLRPLLKAVDLEYLLEREGCLTDEINWEDELSLGEKQRLAIARLLYSKPKYAILDECSSAISDSMTRKLYSIVQEQDITYITIAHRPALKAFHDRILAIGDGKQGFTITDISAEERSAAKKVVDAEAEAAGGADEDAELRSLLQKRSKPYQDRQDDRFRNKEDDNLPTRSFFVRIRRLVKIGWIDWLWARMAASIGGLVLQIYLMEFQMTNRGRMLACLNMMADGWPEMKLLIIKSVLVCFIQPVAYESVLFFQREIGHDMMERAQDYVMERLMRNRNYYKLATVDGRIKDTKQRICGDCHEIFHHFDQMMLNGFFSLLKLMYFTARIGQLLGPKWPIAMWAYFGASWSLLRFVMPDLAAMHSKLSSLEHKFRFVHSRLKMSAESVAFFGGGERERAIADRRFNAFMDQRWLVDWSNFKFGFIRQLFQDQLPNVWFWSLRFYFGVQTAPTDEEMIADKGAKVNQGQEYVGSMCGQVFDALGAMIGLVEQVAYLTGKTARVSELLEILDEIDAEAGLPSGDEADRRWSWAGAEMTTVGSQLNPTDALLPADLPTKGEIPAGWNHRFSFGSQSAPSAVAKNKAGSNYATAGKWWRRLQRERPEHRAKGAEGGEGPSLKFADVDVVTPRGDAVCTNLSCSITKETPMMLTGANATGKTSFVRLLTGLWPAHKGEVTVDGDLFCVPQRIYMTLGTLADQVTYPDTVPKDERTEDVEARLLKLLDLVGIAYLDTEYDDHLGWDHVAQWEDVLSLGEQQRLGMARLFYHKPEFAILDECTSAVSIDQERKLYEAAASLDISCVTISQRLSLPEFHSQEIKLGQPTADGFRLQPIAKVESE